MAEDTRIGSYRLIRRIGAGGMGEVWLAEHAMLGRRAAIKVLHASFAERADVVTRFFNEARAATAIADPGIVQIFDFGHHTDGSAFIVMELLEGETLDARWRRGQLGLGDALRIMRQVASSLGAAHARGIVHRDLKPENIFLVRDPEVPGGERAKILDFGIAKLAADPGLKTQTSVVMGTPTFMAPEQCRGAGLVDQRADVYSLGCVLFAIATGRPPFVAEGTGDLIAMHLREPPPRARVLAPHLSPALDDLIARCLEKDPALRFASGTALAGALAAVATQPSPESSSSRVAIAHADASHSNVHTPAPRAAMPTTLSSSAAVIEAPRPRSRRQSWLAVGALATIACVAFATWRLTASGSDHAVGQPAGTIDASVVAIDAAADPTATTRTDASQVGSEPTKPDRASLDPAKPDSTNQVTTTKSDPTKSNGPDATIRTKADSTEPNGSKLDPMKPNRSKPDSTSAYQTTRKPEPSKNDPAKPNGVKSDSGQTTKPDSVKPSQTAKPDPTKSEPPKPTKPADEKKPCNAPPGIPCER